jgi:hypothetical protein
MKGKMRKHRETGGVNEAEEDVKDKPEARTDAKKIDSEAEEMKKGGRAKRKHGGKTEHKVDGDKAMKHAGRKPRKNGGRTGSDGSPFTSARHGTNPPGRKEMMGKEGFGED